MASPQEVIEIAMTHPADSTPELRRTASAHVVKALMANDYGFVLRPLPVSELDDGECPTCKNHNVHVDQGEAFTDAAHRNYALTQRLQRLDAALRRIANGDPNPSAVAFAALTG